VGIKSRDIKITGGGTIDGDRSILSRFKNVLVIIDGNNAVPRNEEVI
jgi:hypothetical protein